MKRLVAVCLWLVFGSALFAVELSRGSPREDVLAAFGEPVGRSTAGAREVWTYDAGTVVLRDGQVESIDTRLKERYTEAQAAKAPPVKKEPAPAPPAPVVAPEKGMPDWIKKSLLVIFFGVVFILGKRWMRVAEKAEREKTNAPFIR